MELIPIMTREDYIDQLELATTFDPQMIAGDFYEPVYDATKHSAMVVAGSTVSFLPGMTKQQQEDVLDSTLLAQLAANKKHDREKQTDAWYQTYAEVLGNIGWVIKKLFISRIRSCQPGLRDGQSGPRYPDGGPFRE